jgi:aerobic carbon-monoxide dehydrogenase medium subunit
MSCAEAPVCYFKTVAIRYLTLVITSLGLLMYPSPFNYHRAGSVDEAIRLLTEAGDGARVLAGGQTLLVLMKMRFEEPTDVVDIGRIPGLDTIDSHGETVAIGALSTHQRIADSELATSVPIIADCANGIADNQIRSRGTVGGSLASGDPSCDWPSLLLTLDAEVLCEGPDGTRSVSVDGFVEDLYQTVLKPGEIVTGVRFTKPGAASGGAYCAFKRCAPAYPTISVGVQLTITGEQIETARVALGSAGLTPIRSREAEDELVGQNVTALQLEKAADAAVASADPVDDQRGSPDFKRQLIAALTKRAARIAVRRAGGEKVKSSHEYY